MAAKGGCIDFMFFGPPYPAAGSATAIIESKRDNPHYFFLANKQQARSKIYSLTQCSPTVNECDWHILAGNNERINSYCLTCFKFQILDERSHQEFFKCSNVQI